MKTSLLTLAGRIVTRALLAPTIRSFPGVPSLYTALYECGKRFSDAEERIFLSRRIQRGMRIMDIGANIGFYSQFFSDLVGPDGSVYCFEPDSYCCNILKKRLRSRKQVHIFPCALSHQSGDATLVCNPSNRANNVVLQSEKPQSIIEGERCQIFLRVADDWWQEQGCPSIDIIKMDVEGSELNVVRGMSCMLSTCPPGGILFEVNPPLLALTDSRPSELLSLLRNAGYTLSKLNKSAHLEHISDDAKFLEDYHNSYVNVWAERMNS